MLRASLLHRALTLAAFMSVGCGRIGYDLLSQADGSWSPGTGGGGGASLAGSGGSVAGSGGGVAGSAGSMAGGGGSVGTGGARDAAADVLGPVDGPPPNTTCSQAGTPTQVWSFDTDVQGWQLAGSGTMAWTGAVGDPAPGAIEVDWTGTTNPRLVQALGNLSGHIASARVWVDAGTNVTVKLFVQTGTKWIWADGGTVTPPLGQWTCLALDIDNPAFSKNMYDPTNVASIGLEVGGNGQNRVYFDQVAY